MTKVQEIDAAIAAVKKDKARYPAESVQAKQLDSRIAALQADRARLTTPREAGR